MLIRAGMLLTVASALMAAAEPNFMPVPAEYKRGNGCLVIGEKFTVVLTGYQEPMGSLLLMIVDPVASLVNAAGGTRR
jgi:hypothetical protein